MLLAERLELYDVALPALRVVAEPDEVRAVAVPEVLRLPVATLPVLREPALRVVVTALPLAVRAVAEPVAVRVPVLRAAAVFVLPYVRLLADERSREPAVRVLAVPVAVRPPDNAAPLVRRISLALVIPALRCENERSGWATA